MHTVSDTPLCSEMTVAQFLPPPDPWKEIRGTSWGERGKGGNLRDYTWWRHNLGCLYVSVTLKVRYWCTDQHNLLHTYTGYKDTQFKLQYMMQIQTWLLVMCHKVTCRDNFSSELYKDSQDTAGQVRGCLMCRWQVDDSIIVCKKHT